MSSTSQLTSREIDTIYTYDPKEEFLEIGRDVGGVYINKLRYDEMGCLQLALRSLAIGTHIPNTVARHLFQACTYSRFDNYDSYTFRIQNFDESKKEVLSQKIERLFREAIHTPKTIKIEIVSDLP